jgi:hypothetical protein
VNPSLSVTEAQIVAQLDAVLARDATARVLAIRSATRQDWPATLRRRDRVFTVRWCASRLALREALDALEAPAADAPPDGLLLLTPLADPEIPADVAARLARGRVFQTDGWALVRQLFGVQEIDARLGAHDWMPLQLMELARQGAYAPVTSGFLDADTVWREILGRTLHLPSARPDGASLLGWTLRPDADRLLDALQVRMRADMLDWLATQAGTSGQLTVRCIRHGHTADALPLALVCSVLFSPQGEGLPALGLAAVRLERHVGDQPVPLAHGRRWADDARTLAQTLTPEALRGAMDRADAILRELQAGEHAHLSALLPSGLEQRLTRLAGALDIHLSQPTAITVAAVEETANAALEHQLAHDDPVRMDRVRMARRLARWWMRPVDPAAPDLPRQLALQADEGAFVDWARTRLLGGDELAPLSSAYARLRLAVQARREVTAQHFAGQLATALRSAANPGGRAVPLEAALERVVAPLAQHHPVLLLVIDGLSVAIFRELFERCERQGWNEVVREGQSRPDIGVALLPTVTTVSRTSLLSGRITTGTQTHEKAAFPTHPALLGVSAGKLAPRLFHKADLSEDGHLAPGVRNALTDPAQRVVGVVYNAVDDHLDGPQQLQHRWRLEDLRLLMPMLKEAQMARRVVVVTADHGHVLEDGSQEVGASTSDRWRPGDMASRPEEIVVTGPRVRTPDGQSSAVLLWSERARYTGRKTGYHGGCSPAEVVVPMSVFAPFNLPIPGWSPAPPQQPEWWDVPGALQAIAAPPAPPSRAASRSSRRPPRAADVPQTTLFSEEDAPLPAATAAPAPGPGQTHASDWIADLLASPVYASQRQLAARVALSDGQMRQILAALDTRGGKLGRAALAQRLGVHELRLAGFLSVARRMLNVDQSPVLGEDETGMIELNLALLQQQFQLQAPTTVARRTR